MTNTELLNSCTKAEIIELLRKDIHYHFHPFKLSDVLRIRWENKVKEYEKLNSSAMSFLQSCDGKKQDELAKAFNEETDARKKLEIMKEMKPYWDTWDKYIKASKEADKANKDCDKLYNQLSVQQDLEIKELPIMK